jgi:hypothetical protein
MLLDGWVISVKLMCLFNYFRSVKGQLYASLSQWLGLVQGEVTNPKTQKAWVDFLLKDVRLEKDSVELKILPKSKKEKKQMKSQALTALTQNPSSGFRSKSAKPCRSALNVAQMMIGGLRKDSTLFKVLYKI